MRLCRYRNALGIPRRGVHESRMLGDLARNDVIMTVFGSFLITATLWYATDQKRKSGHEIRRAMTLWVIVMAWLFLTGILMHRIFCVRTTIDRMLFPE